MNLHGITRWLAGAIILAVAVGASIYISFSGRLIEVGDQRIDPSARVNPEQRYTLVVWKRALPLPGPRNAQKAAVDEAVASFQSVWTNIEIHVEMLDWDEGHDALREAVATGNPPDVYDMPGGIRLMDSAWQIPIDAYLSDEAREDTSARALLAAAHEGRTWGWPGWIAPHFWIGRGELLGLMVDRSSPWSGEALVEVLEPSESKAMGAVLNPYDGNLLYDVMVTSTGKNPITGDGRRAWTAEELTAAIALFQQLIERGLTGSDPAAMSRSRLSSFWSRQAALIAPVNPWLARSLLERGGALLSGEDGSATPPPATIALPPPSIDSGARSPGHPATVGGYVVFRREPYVGDDHTRAAMMLAEHLSRVLGPWEAAELIAVPAHITSRENWRYDLGLAATEAELMIAWASRAVGPPVPDAHAARHHRIIAQVLGDALVQLWSGAAPAQVAEQVIRSIDGVRAEVANPH